MLTHKDVLALFYKRVGEEQVQQLRELISEHSIEDRNRALERILFQLTSEELFALKITQVVQQSRLYWAVAWSKDTEEIQLAISDVLTKVGISVFGSMNLGMAGWYVEREHFFEAQRALLTTLTIKSLDIEVVEPAFSLSSFANELLTN